MADDVLVLKTSGVPLYAKCYGGKTCKAHPDHALQSGFLAALFSYSKETFSKQGIKSVLFEDFKLDFKIDETKDLLMVFTNVIDEDEKKIKEQLESAYNVFLNKYESKLDDLVFDTNLFLDFDQDLIKLGIVENEAKKDLPLKKQPLWKSIIEKFQKAA